MHNERVKLLAGFSNAIALGFIGFAILRPLTDGSIALDGLTAGWGIAGLAFHGVSHYILGMLRKDEPNDEL